MTNSFCVEFGVDTHWGIPGTTPTDPARLDTEAIMGRFGAQFVCVISLNYLYDSEGLLLKDSVNKVLIED